MLIVEDGTAKANANAYLTYAEVDAYFLQRNNAVWPQGAATQAAKEAAIILATQYLEKQYYGRWKGVKLSKDQALSWPRNGVIVEGDGESGEWTPGSGAFFSGFLISTNEIPQQLKEATAELALKAYQGTSLAPDIAAGAGEIRSQKVGPIEVTFGENRTPFAIFRYVNMILEPLLAIGGGQMRLVRG